MKKKHNHIRELRDTLNISQEDLAHFIGIHVVSLSRIENQPLNLRSNTIQKIAKKLNVEVTDLLLPASSETIPIIGIVQAGRWMCDYAWDAESHQSVMMPHNEQYIHHKKQACLVQGSSMNLLYPNGSIVVWVAIKPNISPLQGKRYIVERIKNGEHEVTLKEYMADSQGREWLVPRSSDPAEQTPILIAPLEDEQIRLVGQVIWSSRVEE